MSDSTRTSPRVVTITREEVSPRTPYAYARNWRWVYSFEGLKKPLARLELAVQAAKDAHPDARIVLAWREGGAA